MPATKLNVLYVMIRNWRDNKLFQAIYSSSHCLINFGQGKWLEVKSKPFAPLLGQFLLEKDVENEGVGHQSSEQEEYASCEKWTIEKIFPCKLTDWPNIQEEMAVMPSVFGDTLVTLLKMLIRTRKRVTSKAIRPGTTWSGAGGFKKQYIPQLGLCRALQEY